MIIYPFLIYFATDSAESISDSADDEVDDDARFMRDKI